MSRGRSWERYVREKAGLYGATVELTRGGHFAIKMPDGSTYYTASTPGDHRCQRHLLTALRRGARSKAS